MKNPVEASTIAERARHGERIDVSGASVSGTLDLSGGAYGQPISLDNCELDGLDLSSSKFAGVVSIRNCRVSGDVDFASATFASELSLSSTSFCSQVTLSNIDANRGLDATSVVLSGGLDAKNLRASRYLVLADAKVHGPVSLLRSRVDGYVDISRSTFNDRTSFEQLAASADIVASDATFGAAANFTSVNVGGQGVFDGTTWNGDATFEGASFGDDLIFSTSDDDGSDRMRVAASTFKGEFVGPALAVKGDMHFTGVAFGSDCDFEACHVDGDILFDRATFAGKASFIGLLTNGQAQFIASRFAKAAYFDMTCLNQGFYGEGLRCDDVFSFALVTVGMDLDITKASFATSAAFNRSTIKANLFAAGASFGGDADFVDVSVGAEAKFTGCTFLRVDSTWDLRWSSFNILHIDEHLADSPPGNAAYRLRDTNVRLSGCKYNRLFAYWLPLLSAHSSGADLQPYTQLESVLQGQGFDDMAARVYYFGHKEVGDAVLHGKDRTGFFRHWLIRVPLEIMWRFVGYGVNSKRLFWPVGFFLLLGFLAFLQPESTCKESGGVCKPVAAAPAWPEASWLTVRTFLPVDIPALEDVKPSHAVIKPLGIWLPADYYASMMRIAGWITVPVLIAALAGFLRRSHT